MQKATGMSIAIAALAVLAVGVGLGAAARDEVEQVGRYQLVESYSGLHVLDTATGQCWRLQRERDWRDLGNPALGRQPAAINRESFTLKLPEERVEMTIRQRRLEPIPGSDNRLLLRLGDITEGQVLLQIQDEEGEPLLREQSLREGDIVQFDVAGDTYYLQLRRLTNVLAGTDFGAFVISKTKPSEEAEAIPAPNDDRREEQ